MFGHMNGKMEDLMLLICRPFSFLETTNVEQKKSENRILIGQRLVPGAGVFLT